MLPMHQNRFDWVFDIFDSSFKKKTTYLYINFLFSAFIRKVYSLLSCQLLLTVVIAAVIALVEPVKLFFAEK